MATRSKVKNVVLKKEGNGTKGPYFIWTVTFENGDSGDYISNNNPQDAFKIGTDADYTKEVKQNGNYTNTSIKPLNQAKGGGKFQSPAGMNKRTALEQAVRLCCHGKIDVVRINEFATNFNKWLNE